MIPVRGRGRPARYYLTNKIEEVSESYNQCLHLLETPTQA
jgi:hypothetical protein